MKGFLKSIELWKEIKASIRQKIVKNYLRVSDTRTIQEAEQVEQRQPGDKMEVDLSYELSLIYFRDL